MAIRSQTQRTLLLTFICSVVLTALMGIYALLGGMKSGIGEEILTTTAIIGGASILGMAAAMPWERRRWHPIGPLALIAIAASAVLLIITVWFEHNWFFNEPDYFKFMVVTCICAISLTHLGLISLAQLKKQLEWVRWATVILIIILTVQLTLVTFYESASIPWFQWIGVVAICDVCGTITIPILHRYSRLHKRDQVRTVELALSLVCPRCSSSQTLSVGRSACGQCGLKFNIEIEEDQCRKCGYPLYQIQSAVCPECGTPIAQAPPPLASSTPTA